MRPLAPHGTIYVHVGVKLMRIRGRMVTLEIETHEGDRKTVDIRVGDSVDTELKFGAKA